MGKPEELRIEVSDPSLAIAGRSGAGGLLHHCADWLAAVRRAFSVRCFVALLLSACVLLPSVFWLPPFRSFHVVFVPDDPDCFSAEIQASFILQKPISLLAANVIRLEYDILEEIGVPNSKVSIISMKSLDFENFTYVVFGVLPDPKFASISSAALSVLKSSLIDLVLRQINISLTLSIFGNPTSFELLKFPGGITVVPVQSAFIWERTQSLFNFKLNNSIKQILDNIDQLKEELKFGLNLRSDENVYVEMTNVNGSTVAPPVTVQASVLSDVGNGDLLPDRLKQLAQVISGNHEPNLGLNHSVFGKVKEVQLSSYLNHSISSLAPSPSPSPSPSPLSPSPSPSPSDGFLNPSNPPYASVPSSSHHCCPSGSYCHSTSPSESPLPYAPWPPSASSPGPAERNANPFCKHGPCFSTSLAPEHPSAPASMGHPPEHTSPPGNNVLGPMPKVAPVHPSLSPASSYGPSPAEENRIGGASLSSMHSSPLLSPSSMSKAVASSSGGACLSGLLVALMLHLFLRPR